MMINILTVIGARPQIIKAAALSRAFAQGYAGVVHEKILHTGQHYDDNMSQVFFEELGIPQPDYNLHAGSGSHGEQTAKMITGIEKVLLSEKTDALVVYGDTNSTLAGAVAASKLHIPVMHVEAGLRSFNMTMPEEINRIACDHLSNVLFSPTQTGIDNLRAEGLDQSAAVFANQKRREIYLTGDIMYDNSMYFSKIAFSRQEILQRYDLLNQPFVLATIHRDNNTDQEERFRAIVGALSVIAKERNMRVVWPVHPRAAVRLKTFGIDTSALLLTPPASFLEMILLEKNASLILTDSGGVQKEAYFFQKPVVILRSETEWTEIVMQQVGKVVDADYERILAAYDFYCQNTVGFPPIFGDGHAAERIAQKIVDYVLA